MKLAKPCIDIGVRTHRLDEMLAFWTGEIGLAYDHLLKIGNGVHQHRLDLNGSVFKLNHARSPLPDTPASGYRELLIASDVDTPEKLTDPDGNAVTLVPRGLLDIQGIGIRLSTRNLAQSCAFFEQVLKALPLAQNRFAWGTSVFLLDGDATQPGGGMEGSGYRYVTVQVYKTDREHQAALDQGAIEGMAPVTLGSTARISFITDPDNNWIEISQRASLTGDLSTD